MHTNMITALGSLGYAIVLWNSYPMSFVIVSFMAGRLILTSDRSTPEQYARNIVWTLDVLCILMWHPLYSWLVSLLALVIAIGLWCGARTPTHQYLLVLTGGISAVTTVVVIYIGAAVTIFMHVLAGTWR